MDIVKALRELYNEKKRLDVAISSLEARVKAARGGSRAKPAAGRRGRKSMSAAEREEVSKRMTLYWEARRAQDQPQPKEVAPPPMLPSIPPSIDEEPSISENQQAQASSTSA
jgi:hypothetical protein